MAVFRPDPEPVQRLRRVPASAFTAGDQPPRMMGRTAAMLAIVVAAWPNPSQPPAQLARPLVAAVIPPPTVNAAPVNRRNADLLAATIRLAWPELAEPRLDPVNAKPDRRYVVPLTLVYGQSPRPWNSQYPEIIAAWPAPWSPPIVARPTVIPSPIIAAQPTPVSVAGSLAAWRPVEPTPLRLIAIAPLALTYGQQPRPSGALSPIELALLARAWEPARPEPPALLGTAAWNVPRVDSPKAHRDPSLALPLSWWIPYTVRQRLASAAAITAIPPAPPPVVVSPPEPKRFLRHRGDARFIRRVG